MPKGKTPYEKELAMRRREERRAERSRKRSEERRKTGKGRKSEILYEDGHYRFQGAQ